MSALAAGSSSPARRTGAALRRAAATGVLTIVVFVVAAGPWAAPAGPFGPAVAQAASPSPSPAGGDLRSSGEGAGAAGNPGFAVLAGFGVVGAGILIAVATTLYVRLTTDQRA